MAEPNLCDPIENISANRIYHYATNPTPAPPNATVVGLMANDTFYFKPINAGNGIQVDEITTPGAITISYTGLPGLPYSYSTLPDPAADATVVATMAGTDFQFRGLSEGSNMVLDDTTNPNVVIINGPTLASNVVVGSTSLVDAQVGNQFRVKPLLPGNNTTLTNVGGGVRVDAASYTYSSNVIPGSTSILGTQVGTNFGFKPLVAGTGVVLDSATIPGAVIISVIPDTYSTIPSPQAQVTVVATKVGNDFQFRGFRGGTNVTLDDVTFAGVIVINGPTYSTPVIPGTFPITRPQVGGDFRFAPLNPGINITMDTTTLLGAITINGPTLASSAGSGLSLVDPQVGNEFRTKRLAQGMNIVLDNVSIPGTIIINGPTYSSTPSAGSFPITDTQVGQDFRFKQVRNGNNIVIDAASIAGTLILNGPTLASTGVGPVSLVNPQVLNEFRIKTLTAGANIVLDTSIPGNVTISGPAPSVYTYSTDVVPGSDATVVSAQVGNNFGFKPFNNGTNITIEEVTLPGALTINGPTYSTPNIPGTFPVTRAQVGNDFRFAPFNSGTNIVMDTTTLPGAITVNGPTYSTPVIPGTFPITRPQVGNDFRMAPLNAGTNIVMDIATLVGAITINGPTLASSAVVGGTPIIDAQVGNQFRARQLLAGTNMTLDSVTTPGGVIINGPTLAANPSAGSSLVGTQVGNQFRIKNLIPGANITLDSVTVPGSVIVTGAAPNVYTYSTDPIVGYDATVVSTQVGNNFGFKPFKAGGGIAIDETSLPGAITITSLAQNVRINESIFVDAIFGNDGTGVRTEFGLPFQTIGAALAVALPGDTVVVRPGNYVETLTLLDQVNIVLNSGANLAAPLVDVIIATGVVTANVYSMGNITGRINILNHTGELYIQAFELVSNGLAVLSMSGSTTNLDVLASTIVANAANVLNIGSSPNSNTRIVSNAIVSTGIAMVDVLDFGQVQIETVELQATTTSTNVVSASIGVGNTSITKLMISTVNAIYRTGTGTIFSISDLNTASVVSPLSVIISSKWMTTVGLVLNASSSKSNTPVPSNIYPSISFRVDQLSNSFNTAATLTVVYFMIRANLNMNVGTMQYDINTVPSMSMFRITNSIADLAIDTIYTPNPAGQSLIIFVESIGSLTTLNGNYASLFGAFIQGGPVAGGALEFNTRTMIIDSGSRTNQVSQGRLVFNVDSLTIIRSAVGGSLLVSLGATSGLYIKANSLTLQSTVVSPPNIVAGALATPGFISIDVNTFNIIVVNNTIPFSVQGTASAVVRIGTATEFYASVTGGTADIGIGTLTISAATSALAVSNAASVSYSVVGVTSTSTAAFFNLQNQSSVIANVDTMIIASQVMAHASSSASTYNIANLTSTNASATVASFTATGTGQVTINGMNWNSSTISQPIISVPNVATLNANITNVTFSNASAGTGSFMSVVGTGSINVSNLVSTSTTSTAIFNQTGGTARVNVDFLTALATAYRTSGGSMFIGTVKSVNNNALEVVRVAGAATVEFAGSYATTGANTVVIDNGSANVSLMGAKLYSTSDSILKSTGGLMNVFSAGSIARNGVNILLITIQGVLSIVATLPQ